MMVLVVETVVGGVVVVVVIVMKIPSRMDSSKIIKRFPVM